MRYIHSAMLSSLLGMLVFMAVLNPERTWAQIPMETLQCIPDNYQYVSVIHVQKLVQSDLYNRSQNGLSLIGGMGDDLAYFAKITGVDIARDISYLLAGKSSRYQTVLIAYGNFDKQAIERYLKKTFHTSEYRQGKIKILPTKVTNNFVEEGITFLSDSQIAVGFPMLLEELAETQKGKFPNILSDPLMSSLITNIAPDEMFWFTGRSAVVLEIAPVPTPMRLFSNTVQSIAGAFILTDSVKGNILIKYRSANDAAGLFDFYKKLASAGQLQENPDVGLKVLSGGFTARQDDDRTTLSLNYTAAMLAKIWYWSNHPIPEIFSREKGEEPAIISDKDNNVTLPVVLFDPKPQYTDKARMARAQGIIVLDVVIRKDGTPSVIKVKRGLGYGLDESAVNTIINRWRFIPATKDGKPVSMLLSVEVNFRLF
jgi:TonB family protein